jgi:hypothetical protein
VDAFRSFGIRHSLFPSYWGRRPPRRFTLWAGVFFLRDGLRLVHHSCSQFNPSTLNFQDRPDLIRWSFFWSPSRATSLCRWLALSRTGSAGADGVLFSVKHPPLHAASGVRREASAYLLSNAQPGDEVVLLAGLGPPPFDYYRERNARKIPGLLFADSASAPLPVPPPQNVWFIGSVLLTPNWAAEADAFRQAHKDRYCAESPQPDTGSVRVWQFRRCTSGDNHFR